MGIDYARVAGDRHEASEVQHERALVLAILGEHLNEREERVVKAYALGASYREIAKLMRVSHTHVRRIHRPAWERVRDRLVSVGLCNP